MLDLPAPLTDVSFAFAEKRDFTINSLLFDPLKMEVLDFVDGVKDIEEKVLRMNSPPKICGNDLSVLQEDPVSVPSPLLFIDLMPQSLPPCFKQVRIVRGVRFVIQFDLTIDSSTLGHMRDCCHKSKVVGPLHFVLPLVAIRASAQDITAQKSQDHENEVPLRVGLKDTGLWKRGAHYLMKKFKGSTQVSSSPTELRAEVVQGLDPEAKAGRVWRELKKISMLPQGSKTRYPPFARALFLFGHTGLLPLLFPFLRPSKTAVRVRQLHGELLPETLSSLECSEAIPLELSILGLGGLNPTLVTI